MFHGKGMISDNYGIGQFRNERLCRMLFRSNLTPSNRSDSLGFAWCVFRKLRSVDLYLNKR